jgi:hypothetical protein
MLAVHEFCGGLQSTTPFSPAIIVPLATMLVERFDSNGVK